ncbi:MAG: PTS glucitol/sorbitol transporter subunit IIC [Eubacteriaceae bacterium]|jgi:PTS system glucitol/sorbitol-specific IIC component
MEFLSNLATGFIGLFSAGGEQFTGYITGIIPTLVCLITFVNALVAIIGKDKVDKFGLACSKNMILRYTLLPFLALFFLTNPMCYTLGRFMEEKYKPAFYDATVSFCHPITGLFPHANAGEYFVYGGIAAGLTTLGKDLGPLAVRYFLVGLVVILIRGIICQGLTVRFMTRKEAK